MPEKIRQTLTRVILFVVLYLIILLQHLSNLLLVFFTGGVRPFALLST